MAEFVTITQEVIDAQIERWRGVLDALAPNDGPVDLDADIAECEHHAESCDTCFPEEERGGR